MFGRHIDTRFNFFPTPTWIQNERHSCTVFDRAEARLFVKNLVRILCVNEKTRVRTFQILTTAEHTNRALTEGRARARRRTGTRVRAPRDLAAPTATWCWIRAPPSRAPTAGNAGPWTPTARAPAPTDRSSRSRSRCPNSSTATAGPAGPAARAIPVRLFSNTTPLCRRRHRGTADGKSNVESRTSRHPLNNRFTPEKV